jgi:hypothetical protein
MNLISSNLLISCRMVSHLSGVYLLSFLLDRLVRCISAQFVLNHLPRDPGYIRYLPCKDIKIVPEKSDESEFLFGTEAVADPELLVCVAGVHYNLLIFYPQDSLQLTVRLLIDERWCRGQCKLSAFRCWRDSWRVADWWLGRRYLARRTATVHFGRLGSLFLSCFLSKSASMRQ